MANRRDRVPQNVPGKFYVDESCIYCDVCRNTAPTVFAEDKDNGMAYVFNQPKSEEELEAAREAMDACPTESIGDDGEA